MLYWLTIQFLCTPSIQSVHDYVWFLWYFSITEQVINLWVDLLSNSTPLPILCTRLLFSHCDSQWVICCLLITCQSIFPFQLYHELIIHLIVHNIPSFPLLSIFIITIIISHHLKFTVLPLKIRVKLSLSFYCIYFKSEETLDLFFILALQCYAHFHANA